MHLESPETSSAAVRAARLKWKTRLFAIFVILSNSFGNLFLFIGMRQAEDVSQGPLAFLKALLHPAVVAGVVLLISWLLSRMMMMSWADLSYVLPVTAFGYVVNAVLGWLFLSEVITPQRWIGTLLIVTGTILVGLGSPQADPAAGSARVPEKPL